MPMGNCMASLAAMHQPKEAAIGKDGDLFFVNYFYDSVT